MRNLQDLLKRFSSSLQGDTYLKEEVIRAIKEVSPVKVSSENIKIKDGVLNVSVSPLIKSEIFLKEEQLLMIFKSKKLPVRKILYS